MLKLPFLRATLLALLSITFYPATAGSTKHTEKFGNFIVHYNTLPSDFLSARTAKRLGIRRGRDRILVNITVKQKTNSKEIPVAAKVNVRAHNRTGQLKYTKMLPVQEGKGIYYIGEFRVANREHLFFTVTVTPKAKQAATHTFKFDKEYRTR